jgi:ATP-binding cassette subfamily A (ABC1) protein 3
VGTSTALKATHGDAYSIREIQNDDGEGEAGTVWSTTTSADATKKVLELEEISDASYSVQFPTLDQVFLKATDSTTHALHEGGDGIEGEIDAPKELEEVDSLHHENIDLDVGHAVGFFRQILVILLKRYTLVTHMWISSAIALAIPIIIAAALSKFVGQFDSLRTCQQNFDDVRNINSPNYTGFTGTPNDGTWVRLAPLESGGSSASLSYSDGNSTVVGPVAQWEGPTQDELFLLSTFPLFNTSMDYVPYGYPADYKYNATNQTFATRANATTLDGVISIIKGDYGESGFGIFAPESEKEPITLFHHIGQGYSAYEETMAGMSLITNRIANSTTANGKARIVTSSQRFFRVIAVNHDFRALPLVIIIILGLITSTSVAIIYPTDERINNVRSLQYCNGVSPAALWIAYLIFDMHVMIISAVVTYACIFTGSAARVWFSPGYVLGALILFGIATYLGLYLLSMFIKKAAFAIAAAIHLLLFVLYFAGYIITEASGTVSEKYDTYNALQYGLGLSSPAANLARAMFIGIDNFDITCGRTGGVVPNSGSFNLYSGVFVNLLIQIVFLSGAIALMEYGSSGWFFGLFGKKRIPSRLQYVIEDGYSPPAETVVEKKVPDINSPPGTLNIPVLVVERVSKFFGKIFATENVSFNIATNEVLALIGPNGAGKTSMINMIRGILKPNYGYIHLDGVSVLTQPAKARVHMGVCPQDDAIDELNVRQTLNFYAAVKGLKDVRKNVDLILDAFNIRSFESVPIKKLSGGTRRKVMVSIALLGKFSVLISVSIHAKLTNPR